MRGHSDRCRDLRAVFAGKWPEGNLTMSGDFSQSPGGKGANEAVALRRLGVATELVSVVGDDMHGKELVESLLAEDVGLHVRMEGGTSTGTAVQIVSTDPVHGTHKLTVVCSAANFRFGEHEVERVHQLLKCVESRPHVRPHLLVNELTSTYLLYCAQLLGWRRRCS